MCLRFWKKNFEKRLSHFLLRVSWHFLLVNCFIYIVCLGETQNTKFLKYVFWYSSSNAFLSTNHFVYWSFCLLVILPTVILSTVHFVSRSFCICFTGHIVCCSFCLLVILSTGHFVYWIFCLLVILSASHFGIMSFWYHVILSIINYICRSLYPLIWLSVEIWAFYILVIFSCHFVFWTCCALAFCIPVILPTWLFANKAFCLVTFSQRVILYSSHYINPMLTIPSITLGI